MRALLLAALLVASCRHDGVRDDEGRPSRRHRFGRAFAAGMQQQPESEAHASCRGDYQCRTFYHCAIPRYGIDGVCVPN